MYKHILYRFKKNSHFWRGVGGGLSYIGTEPAMQAISWPKKLPSLLSMGCVFFKMSQKGSLLDHFSPIKKVNSFKYSLNKWFRMGKSVVVVEKKIKCHLGLTLMLPPPDFNLYLYLSLVTQWLHLDLEFKP